MDKEDIIKLLLEEEGFKTVPMDEVESIASELELKTLEELKALIEVIKKIVKYEIS